MYAARRLDEMTQAEFGEWIGAGASTVHNWRKTGRFPATVELACRLYYENQQLRDDLDTMIESIAVVRRRAR